MTTHLNTRRKMKIILLSVIVNFCIFQSATATPLEMSIDDALNKLEKVIHEEQKIQEFFHKNIVIKGDHKNCGKPSNCADLMSAGFKKSGDYTIHFKPWIKAKAITVYCDMETDGGGWTVFQRRNEYPERQINFTRNWKDYSTGFGNIKEEFWLGNDNLYLLTTQDNVELRIDMKDFDDNHRYAKYEVFEIANFDGDYKMKVGQFSGNAGDAFSSTNDLTFVTIDRNDVNNCAKTYRGGWWYGKCHVSNLNGEYLHGKHETFANGVNWEKWLGYHYSLKFTEMKIRPKSFT